MAWLKGLLIKQGQFLLSNERHATLHAVILALFPYTIWLSVAIVVLMTLRKGWRKGVLLLVPAISAYFVLSSSASPATIALINALFVFMPAYIAACILRVTTSWRAVASAFFIQIAIAVVLLQLYMPELIVAQYAYIQAALRELQSDSALLTLINNKTGLNQLVLGSYLLGLQAVGLVFSACISLMLARYVQSQLYYPGGFKREMLTFRGNRIELLLLVIIFIAANQQNVFAMSLLPILIFYFMLAGLSLSFNVLSKQRPVRLIILSIASLLLLPFIMLPVYVIFGSIDSLFNLRSYLLPEASKTI